jgi:periplasmic copper chaperone A
VRVAPPIIGVVVAALILAPAAAAHVTLNPREWEAGGFAKFDVRVPNERDNADTTRITLKFPPEVISASFEPVPGWDRTVKMAQLDEPIDDEGEQITERIDTVTWTGGRIRPGEFQEFGVSFQVPEDSVGEALAFPAVQRYSGGETVRWIGPEDADTPAPLVQVLEPAEEEGAAAAEEPAATPSPAPASAESDDEGSSDTLSIIALIVGIAGLGAGLAALLTRGRKREGVTA